MIDFQKTEVFGVDLNNWLSNELLQFSVKKLVETDKEISTRTAKFWGLEFVIVPQTGSMFINGSLHKYFNFMKGVSAPNQITHKQIKEGFNGNQFSHINLVEALLDIEDRFNVSFMNSELHNLEIGVNIHHSFNAELILLNLLMFQGKTFTKPYHYTYRQRFGTRFHVKVYDKQLQYGLAYPVLRFELKYVKMIDLNTIGIVSLNDLLNDSVLKALNELLLSKWDKIEMYDYTVNEELLTAKEKERIYLYQNENYWRQLPSNKRHRSRGYLRAIQEKYSKCIQKELEQLIDENWKQLVYKN